MKLVKYLIYYFFLSAVTIIGFAQTDIENTATVNQLNEMMRNDSNLVILDVRNSHELEDISLGHIDGIVNIPLPELENRLGELDDYKDNDIAVICRSGRRSATATDLLVKSGFNAVNVLGGMVKYRATENKSK